MSAARNLLSNLAVGICASQWTNILLNIYGTLSTARIHPGSVFIPRTSTRPVRMRLPERNFQFCTHEIVIYIFSIYQKSKFFSLLKKFSLRSLQFNHIYFSVHLQINRIYFSVHLQTQYKKKIGLFVILKSR